jgi:spore maturation protein CgeB
MKILIVGRCVADWHESAWLRAVLEIGYDAELFCTKGVSSFFDRLQRRILFGPLILKINRSLIKYISTSLPDVVVLYRALEISGDTVKSISNLGITVVTYNNDNILGFLGKKRYWAFYKRQIKVSDLNFVYRASDVVYFRKLNPPVYVLKSHYIPWLHLKNSNSQIERDIDLSFLGHYEPDGRDNLMASILRKFTDKNIVLKGSNWMKSTQRSAWNGKDTSEVVGVEYSRLLQQSKISICFLSTWNNDQYTRRVFEIPAAGGLLLCQRTNDLKSLYKEGDEAIFFDGEYELINQLKFLFENPLEIESIAAAGHRRALSSGYDIHSRMNEWIAALNKVKKI